MLSVINSFIQISKPFPEKRSPMINIQKRKTPIKYGTETTSNESSSQTTDNLPIQNISSTSQLTTATETDHKRSKMYDNVMQNHSFHYFTPISVLLAFSLVRLIFMSSFVIYLKLEMNSATVSSNQRRIQMRTMPFENTYEIIRKVPAQNGCLLNKIRVSMESLLLNSSH